MKAPSRPGAGDLWGGLAAALVALPSAVAFGVAIYSPLGPQAGAGGAAAGLVGAAVLGLVAPLIGGSARLISAPCAPAAAVLGALAAEAAANAPDAAWGRLALVALLAGALQLAFASARGGRLVKFLPYPVVSGYLTGVAALIVLKQAPSFLGLPHGVHLGEAWRDPGLWRIEAVSVGAATAAATLAAPWVTRRVPAPVLGLGLGAAVHVLLGLRRPELLEVAGNPLVVGALTGASPLDAAAARLAGFGALGWADLRASLAPAATLAALLSIDALKTCVVSDALTGDRHDADRVLAGQGLANIACAALGGAAGSGTMGPTMVNISGGGETRRSALTAGVLSLLVLLAGAPLLARLPLAALAGLLFAVAARMADRESLRLLRDRTTFFDFAVTAVVAGTAVGAGLIQAAGAGLALSILLFIREQARGSVVRRKTNLAARRSLRSRSPQDMALLDERGREAVVAELQGPLFFGTADQLMGELAADLAGARYAALDLRRVRSMDLTAAQMLSRLARTLSQRGGRLVLSRVPAASPSGRDLAAYLRHLGLGGEGGSAREAGSLDEALQWIEERLLDGAAAAAAVRPLALTEFPLLRGRSSETLDALAAVAAERAVPAGRAVFRAGDPGDALFLVRRGSVRVELPLAGQAPHPLASFGPGEFFGEMAFLDGAARSADAVAVEDCELYELSRARFEEAAREHPRLARQAFENLASSLALRLRRTDAELSALRES